MSRLRISVMALEPSLWGTLPNELLHLIFARLPIARIGQLRVLSMEWKRNVDCKDSEFNHVFDATLHPNMFALLSWKYFDVMSVWGNIYDVQADKQHVYKIDGILQTVVGDDGGLVCCVSKSRSLKNNPIFFSVVNPLTKQKMQLPPLLCMGVEESNTLIIVVKVVKLTMDRKTKEYKVFVVGYIENGGQGFFAEVYDSHIKEWMVVEATQGHIIGWDYNSNWSFGFPCVLYVYNCANGTLQQFNLTDIALGLEPRHCILIEDQLFVLHKDASSSSSILQKYCISKFHFSEQTTTWMKLEVCNHITFKCFPNFWNNCYDFGLWGCKGFLLVHGFEHALLYNLSTCEWHNLRGFRKTSNYEMMCMVSWSANA